MGKSGYLKNRQKAYEWLKATFPKAFAVNSPLKIGIHVDVFAVEAEDRPATVHLRRAIHLHVSRAVYLHKIKTGVERIDLEGLGCGQIVTKDASQAAKDKLKTIRDYYRKTKQEKEVGANSQCSNTVPVETTKMLDKGRGGRPILKLKKKLAANEEA